jgi:nucleoside-diphosphate-sugar epimerase
MRVFIAGATGAIGKQLVPRLVASGHQVHGMTHNPSKRALLRDLGAVPVVADALDGDQVAEAVTRARPDVIVHQLTAIGPIDLKHMEESFAATNRLRTEGTDHLLAAGRAAGVKRFVAQSNISAYARSGEPVKTEEQGAYEPDPVGGMGANLRAMRHLESAVLGAEWTEGIVLRYGWFYGPGTSIALDPLGSQIELLRKRQLPIVGGGTGIWSFIHIVDAATATLAAVEGGPAGIYNVVDDEPSPVSEWVPALAAAVGAKRPLRVPRWVGRLAAGEWAVVAMTEIRGSSNDKAKRELGWQLRYPSWRQGFAEGLG